MPDRISQMEDKERGNEWEMVSLTASAYSDAPGPQKPHEPQSKEESKLDTSSYTTKQYEDFESPSSLFMSGHFLLPREKEMDTSSKHEQEEEFNNCKETDELQRSLSLSGFEERENVVVMEEVEEERENVVTDEARENEGAVGENEGWWKKQIVLFYKSARERNTMWSVFIAATLIGVAVIGQRWKKEKLQLQQMKLHFNIDNERISCMVGPLNKFKGISIGTNHNNRLVPGYGTLG